MRTVVACLSLLVHVVILGAACGPSDPCRAYVACQRAYDPTVDTTPYDDGGSCWLTLQTANACTAQCKQALDALAQAPGHPAECDIAGAETDAGSG